MLTKNEPGLYQGVLRANRSPGPNLHDKAVIVGPLADAHILGAITNAKDRREDGVDRNDPEFLLRRPVVVDRRIPATGLYGHLHLERDIDRQRGDLVVGIGDRDR